MEERILVFTRSVGFVHDSIPEGIAACRLLGTLHEFEVRVSDDPTLFSDAALSRYDALVFMNTTGPVLEGEQRGALERFVRSGKGFVGVHGAAATLEGWAWYEALVGATFKAHPEVQDAMLIVEDRAHPATRGLPGRWPRTDEWYGFHAPVSAARVLVTLDETSYDPGPGAMGERHPVSWCHVHDGGRSFYTALGHTKQGYGEPLFLEHLGGGIRWALGRGEP